jgi:hypothetical protein
METDEPQCCPQRRDVGSPVDRDPDRGERPTAAVTQELERRSETDEQLGPRPRPAPHPGVDAPMRPADGARHREPEPDRDPDHPRHGRAPWRAGVTEKQQRGQPRRGSEQRQLERTERDRRDVRIDRVKAGPLQPMTIDREAPTVSHAPNPMTTISAQRPHPTGTDRERLTAP